MKSLACLNLYPIAAKPSPRLPRIVPALFALAWLPVVLLALLSQPLRAFIASDVGMIDVTTRPSVYKDSATQQDSTAGINEAITYARDLNKALFFPSGTYYVTDTILAEENPPGGCGSHLGTGTVQLIGQTTGSARPLLRLKDNSAGFGSASTPKTVVRITSPNDPNCRFRDGLRGIDLNLGNNPGAIGVEFDAAQDSFFEDVSITASQAFAGFTAVPGRGMSAVNITVNGGQYGFYSQIDTGPTSLGGSLVGIRLYNQTVAGIYLTVWRGMSITGLEFVGAGVPAIILKGGNVEQGNVSILDASIDIAGGAAISNPDNRFVNLRKVHVRGAVTIVDNPSGFADLAPVGAGWTRVNEYTYTPPTLSGVTTYNLIGSNGATSLARNTTLISDTEAFAGSVPSNLVSRHVYPNTPSFQDAGVVLATPGSTDQIQALLNGNAKVYLPAGVYYLTAPITLNAGNTLMGVPGLRSVLTPVAPLNYPAQRSWVIETVNSAAASTVLQDVAIDTPIDGMLGGIRWQAGRNSIVRRVRSFLGAGHHETNKHNYEFVGNGGGRWYGLVDHATIDKGATVEAIAPDPNYRKVFINGTSEPLTIYGFNVERGGSAADPNKTATQYPFVELVGASNVRFLGTKGEARDASVLIRGGCNNIFIPVWFTNSNAINNPLFELHGLNNTNLAFYSLRWPYSGTDTTRSTLVQSDYTHLSVTRDNFVGAYKVGNINLGAWDLVGQFTSEDIGNPAQPGSGSLTSGVYTVAGGGTDIYGTSDQFHFLHQSRDRNGRIIARVTSVQNTHAYAKAGLMFRESTAAGAKNVDLVLTPVSGIQLLHRAATGGTTTSDAIISGPGAPYWLRLERHGDTFTGFQSPDGSVWFLTGATTFAMNNATQIGLAVTSHDNAVLNTSTFDNVSISNVPVWTAIDIGSVGAAGSTNINYATDTFTLNGAGANIYTATDSFHFNYLTWNGDATLVAEVTSVENTSTYAKGGLMIRKSLAANAAHATVSLTPGFGVEFLRRTADGNTTVNTNTTGVSAPRFVKLVRSGSTFSAYHSPDGGTWTQLGATQTITMGSTVYVGLVSCSIINTSNLCTATFESVYIK